MAERVTGDGGDGRLQPDINRKLLAQLPKLIGKTISHIVVKSGHHPRAQLALVFTDGTWYEIYCSSDFAGAGALDGGGVEDATQYFADGWGEFVVVPGDGTRRRCRR